MTKPPKEHLKKIEDDQPLNGIETIDDTQRNDTGRHWFVSQEIGPKADMAWYNRTSGRLIPGPYGYFVPDSSWSTASVAALTLTCPAGHRYRVYYAAARNVTQATDAVLSGTINGNAWTDFNQKNGVVMAVLDTIVTIGASTQVFDGVAAVGCNALREIWLNAGDTLTLTLSVCNVGVDNCEHMFLFEDYEV